MHDVGFGDVVFIILILGVVHGIMSLITKMRKRNAPSSGDSEGK